VQRDLGLRTVGALDVRINVQDLFALSVADQYIKTECIKTFGNRFRSSTGLDMTSRGRGVSVILEMEQEQPF
jgi:hypothetical protein